MAENSKLDNDKQNWQRMRFKNNKVWVAVDNEGKPIVKNGKYLIKYQLAQDYEYWVHPNGVRPIDSPQIESQSSPSASPPKKKVPATEYLSDTQETIDQDTVCIYTDGASSGNPGPAGIGILMRFGSHEKEISNFIGNTTNNIAELEAIRIGLLELKKKDLPVRIFTDSNYAYGVLVLGWKARKNQKLIRSIKNLMSAFRNIKLIKVKGHEGLEGNERADFLATSAIKNRLK
jgi:ribonuclease HI